MTQKEAVYALLRGEKPDYIVNGWEPFQVIFDDVNMHCRKPLGRNHIDCWGVTFIDEPGQPGKMPSEDPELLACDDITTWKDKITPPDVMSWELDFEATKEKAAEIRANGKFAMSILTCGVFEEAHHILGFEEALVDFLTEEDDMHSLVEALFEWKFNCIKRQMEGWHPDGFVIHDDWGSKDTLLLPPEVWREYFKEGYRKIFDFIHENGSFVVLHSDSNNALIAADMEEIGVDIWQGALPSADIARLQKELPGKMIFMGGFDSGVIDRVDTTPEEIKTEVMRAVNEYLPNGRYIPCITYGLPGSIYPGVDDQITEIIYSLNK